MTSRRFACPLALAFLIGSLLTGCAAEPATTPSATATTPVETPTPTPTPTPEAIEPTCENTSTAEFQTMMAGNGWVSWTLPHDGIGTTPFDSFPHGAPTVLIACRWGNDPELATDNIIDLSWARVDPVEAAAAQDQLAAQGYERIEAPEGVYLALKGDAGEPGMAQWLDDEGYAQAYLFTAHDVRWAMIKDQLQYVKAPDEEG